VAEDSTCPYCESSSKKDTGLLKALLITFVIIIGIASIGYFSLKWIGNPFQFFQGYFSSDRVYEVTKASPNLPVSRAPTESISIEDIDNLHKRLKGKQFETLNTILEGYQKAYETDCKDEFKVYDAFRAFALSEPSNEEYFNQWIAATPYVYFPYLAAAEFYYKQAWDSRGAAWATETTKAQFKGMYLNFEKAEKHINTALEMNPNLLCAYILLLGIQNASGLKEDEDRTFAQALKYCPESFLIRHQYLWCKLPRWGGGYEMMEACVKDSESEALSFILQHL
jgi:tetratricopeptide (TPR) repeat protein